MRHTPRSAKCDDSPKPLPSGSTAAYCETNCSSLPFLPPFARFLRGGRCGRLPASSPFCASFFCPSAAFGLRCWPPDRLTAGCLAAEASLGAAALPLSARAAAGCLPLSARAAPCLPLSDRVVCCLPAAAALPVCEGKDHCATGSEYTAKVLAVAGYARRQLTVQKQAVRVLSIIRCLAGCWRQVS